MKRKIILLLLTIVMIFPLLYTLPITNAAALSTDDNELFASGACGKGLTWTILDNTLTISGTGPMDDYFEFRHSPWYEYLSSNSKLSTIFDVIIKPGVTSIGREAFNSITVSSITIPDTVISIGSGAFKYCYGLKEIYLPASVSNIGDEAFSGSSPSRLFTVSGDNPYFCSDKYGALYTKDMTELIRLPADFLEKYEKPDGIGTIEQYMELEDSYHIPDSVKKFILMLFPTVKFHPHSQYPKV